MPLSASRRRKPPGPVVAVARAPIGQSALEQLPLEILTSIFIESQNLAFVRTSKTIFAALGQSPSEWLILEFCGHGWRGIFSHFRN
jgi:hypothetical protein